VCGIAGLAYRRAHDFRQEAERRVQTMSDVQAHRGPDGEGLWSTSIGATGVTLGQKRLAKRGGDHARASARARATRGREQMRQIVQAITTRD
jgi:asparagine synthetase B (glutamine-hydrolysing)